MAIRNVDRFDPHIAEPMIDSQITRQCLGVLHLLIELAGGSTTTQGAILRQAFQELHSLLPTAEAESAKSQVA